MNEWMNDTWKWRISLKVDNEKKNLSVTSSISILIINFFSFPFPQLRFPSLTYYLLRKVRRKKRDWSNGGIDVYFDSDCQSIRISSLALLTIINDLRLPSEALRQHHYRPNFPLETLRNKFIIYFHRELKLYFLPDLWTSLKCRTFSKAILFSYFRRSVSRVEKVLSLDHRQRQWRNVWRFRFYLKHQQE